MGQRLFLGIINYSKNYKKQSKQLILKFSLVGSLKRIPDKNYLFKVYHNICPNDPVF